MSDKQANFLKEALKCALFVGIWLMAGSYMQEHIASKQYAMMAFGAVMYLTGKVGI